jgi:hypothetical protein
MHSVKVSHADVCLAKVSRDLLEVVEDQHEGVVNC